MPIKTLTEILGLSLELKDYEERVQKRYDYIQEQLEKDPEFVAYDHLEYWDGRIELHLIFKEVLIDTNGEYYQFKENNWVMVEQPKNKPYLQKGFHFKQHGTKSFQTHRVVASTFIPKYEHLSETAFWKLEVNHKDGDKHNPKINNLEWMTKSENTQHALENGLQTSGINDPNTIPYLATVVMEGPYKGQQFILAGTAIFESLGLSRSSVRDQSEGKFRAVYGCTWKPVSKEESQDYQLSVPDGFIEFMKNNTKLSDPKVKPILVTIVDGPNAGYQFCLYGATEVIAHGFGQAYVSPAARKNRKYRGCMWKYVSQEEASQYPRGATEEIIKSAIVK